MDYITKMHTSYDQKMGYIIEFDEGLQDKYSCIISEQDIVRISFGNITYKDYKQTKQRRKLVVKRMLFNDLFGEEADFLLEQDEFYFEDIFKKFENYIIQNDIFVEKEDMDDFFDENEYESLEDSEKETVTIIIEDKRVRDIFGITVNKDNSFELYTKRPKHELTKMQIEFLQNIVKDFVKSKLKLKINFGRDLNGPIKIKGLYDSVLRLVEYQTYEDSEIDILMTK